jgi:uroporphyrin-III C-methyltransferase
VADRPATKAGIKIGTRTGTKASGSRVGRVILVGAGPGEPDLLTVRGARRLGEADLVLYDALSSEGMRAYAPLARWFYVGKRACRQSIGQDLLNRLMIKQARRGHVVVRLKCGDPFVFGRGGEELLALAAAGIPCEVVPGVSAAVAAPALAGIPVTHRGAASAFTVISGHHEETYRPLLAGLPVRGTTVVVMMGLGQRASIAAALREFGWDAETPAAVVIGAATKDAWRWTGTLRDLETVEIPATAPGTSGAPGLLVIGQVVGVAGEIERLRRERGTSPDSQDTAQDTSGGATDATAIRST